MDQNNQSQLNNKMTWTQPVINVILLSSARLGTATNKDSTAGQKS
jgi:hypothetical protein